MVVKGSQYPVMAVDGGTPGPEKDNAPPSEDSIRVVCRFRPLNDTEERTGSKFIVKFPAGNDDQCVTIGVSAPFPIKFFCSLHYRIIECTDCLFLILLNREQKKRVYVIVLKD